MANSNNFLTPATAAVDPTAAQVAQIDQVVVDVTIDGTGTTTTINHNMNMSAADLAAGWPKVTILPTSVHASDGTGAARVSSSTANTVTLTFITGVAQTLRVVVDRPNTSVR